MEKKITLASQSDFFLHASLIVRYSEDNRMYLYDIIDIKKETSNSLEP